MRRALDLRPIVGLARAASVLCLGLTPLVAQAEAVSPPTLVVYLDVDPGTDPRGAAALRALRAQLSDVNVALEVEAAAGASDLRRRMDQAAQGAPGAGGRRLGVLWLDVASPADILVFVSDAGGARALVRRIRVEPGADAAALEETGIVVRSTVNALLEGRVIGMEAAATASPAPPSPPAAAPPEAPPPVVFAPQPPPGAVTLEAPSTKEQEAEAAAAAAGGRPPARASRLPGHFDLCASYVGGVFTSPGGWSSGAAFGARYVAPFGGYAGVGYDLIEPSTVSTPTGSSPSYKLDLVQRPISVAFGYELRPRERRLEADAELALVIDDTSRATLALASPTPAADSVQMALAPRVRGALLVFRPLWLTAGAGADIVVGRLTYDLPGAGRGAPQPGAIQPLAVRPRLEVGLRVELP